MRRQNPPQAYLDKASEIEKYSSPLTTAAIYGTVGILYAVFIALIFGILLYKSVLNPTAPIVTIFAAIAFIPAIFAFLTWFLRPNDPLTSHIRELADVWRRPLNVTPEQCTFKVNRTDGEILCVDLSFYYPVSQQTAAVKERLYTYVHSTLTCNCTIRVGVPTPEEIEHLLDRPLEMLAAEAKIPVLYLEVRNVYSSHDQDFLDMRTLGTGTWN